MPAILGLSNVRPLNPLLCPKKKITTKTPRRQEKMKEIAFAVLSVLVVRISSF
jgi:hypothetical protein